MTWLVLLLLVACIIVEAVVVLKTVDITLIAKGKPSFIKKEWEKPRTKVITSSLISIIIGLLVGCIIIICFCKGSFKQAYEGIQLIFSGVFALGKNANGQIIYGFNSTNIGNMLFNAMPLVMTGLSVALAFKTGLFNIGAPGQYLMGTAASLIIALAIPTSVVPSFIVWILAFLGAMIAGGLWGSISGFFKAFLNVNEVITCIMTNWIAANFVSYLFDSNIGPFKWCLDPSNTKNSVYVYQTTHNNVATSKMGLDLIFPNSQVNGGIIIAIVIAVLVFIIINKTTFGYELKACGSNRDAAKYAGINAKRNIVLSMVMAGALAGAGAALYYLSGNTEFYAQTYQTLPVTGFNGIPVALLAMNSPIGVIFSSIFMAYLDVAGMQLKYLTAYNEHITSVVAAIIVYFSAFSLIIREYLSNSKNFTWLKKIFSKKNAKKEDVE